MNRTPSFALFLFIFVALNSSAFALADPALKNTPAAPQRLRQSVSGDAIRFVFRNYDGEYSVVCKHRLASASSPYDWKVECSDGKNIRSEYIAHVALSAYLHQGNSALSIELLYWLTSGTRLQSEVGSTTWMHFGTNSPLLEVTSSQTIEKGTAGLYLEINVGKMQSRLRSPAKSYE